jgi:hypothetical protein
VYDDIRHRFPRYRIAIFYVYANEETIRARVKSREEKTGRGVPEKELVDSMLAPDKSLGKLVTKVDFIARIDNNFDVPRLAYGARFPTEIYTRRCHWIPRLFA